MRTAGIDVYALNPPRLCLSTSWRACKRDDMCAMLILIPSLCLSPSRLLFLPPSLHSYHPFPFPSVDLDGTILEKPDDEAHAHAMLSSLSGRQHLVHSGVAVFSSIGPRSQNNGTLLPVVSFCETTRVTFAALTSEEIWSYVRSGEPMDKAGAYGIQGLGGQMVRGIDGCYFTVMGLPMHRLSAALAQMVIEGSL